MNLRYGVPVVASMCLLLGACGGDKTPKGQVAATVNKDEITLIDLRNEMGSYRAPDPKTQKLAERAALDQIVTRKLLAEAARKQKLDKTPEYAQAKEKLDETLLIRQWQERIVKSVPAPSKDEIERFVAGHPDLYTAHKVLLIDQIRMPRVNDAQLFNQLRPLNSLEEVAQLLASKKIPFQQGAGEVDTLQVPPDVVAKLLSLPAGEVFVLPQGELLVIGKIREVQVRPLPADVPAKHAQQLLKQTRTRETVQRELGSALAAARNDKEAVKYAKAFEPPPAKAPAAKPAPQQK
jgi:EpsD family peptidyl-prolyl cis-trans isomerase